VVEEREGSGEQCQDEDGVEAGTEDIGVLPVRRWDWQIGLVNYSLIIHLLTIY
jgi:hypothetical protein